MNKEKFFDAMEKDIQSANIPESEKTKLMQNLLHLKEQKINLMITGATGSGKSSTINALFDMEVAKVGVGVNPETMDIAKYELDNLILWDSPGLGDGKEADNRHAKNIIKKLNELDNKGELLIDLVLVILDGSTRDLGTSYELINKVIIPNLGENKEQRILVAINQADVAMKGRYWNYEKNQPEQKLKEFLDEKAVSVKKRIKEATGVDIDPIYYSAGFKEEGEEQQKPYNLSKLLYYIVKATPEEKRLSYIDNLNEEEEMWKDDDGLKDYRAEVQQSFFTTVKEHVVKGAEIGGKIGSVFGKAGEFAGKVVGGVVGGLIGIRKKKSGGGRSSGGGGGCYITTAVCEYQNKQDDCYELTQFRKFRDEWLLNQPDGKELISEYYETAPQIVEQIEKLPNKGEVYKHINEQYLTPCLAYIENNQMLQCKKLYTEMMHNLYEEKKLWH
ncbi:GTPase family protein [Kurthia populi]|uniref:GTPase family protein n=1 Tax=Kurthia populi TaxID=1562132 RepID=A0ABW5Y1S3_9BACL